MSRHTVKLGPRSEPIPFAVCIPSKGRSDVLRKTLAKMPFLESVDTFIGYESDEETSYASVVPGFKFSVIRYRNPTGSVAVAREHLRQAVVRAPRNYRYVVVTDDNARYTQKSLHNLVATAATLPPSGFVDIDTLTKDQGWCIVSGMHSTAAHFDRGRIGAARTFAGYTSYQQFGMIFQVYPMSLYRHYSYPADAYGLDDRHLILWALDKGLTADAFRVAMGAPFTKARYMVGGQGTPAERALKCGRGIARLAADFPLLVGAKGTFPIAWQTAVALRDGKTVDRLAGGAMRKESALQTPTFKIRRSK